MKQNYYLGKSYLIANTMIGINEKEDRRIIDDTDIENTEKVLKSLLNNDEIDIKFYDDENQYINNDFIIKKTKDKKLYVLLPWISKRELKDKYQNNLPFYPLEDTFKKLTKSSLIKRDRTDQIILRNKEKHIMETMKLIPKAKSPKVLKKEYYVSQK